MITDFHSHCLPGLDDGAKDVAESTALLQMLVKQGVGRVCLTPHYYKSLPVARFLEARNTAVGELAAAASGMNFPKFEFGAEVHIEEGLGDIYDIDKLSLGDTGYILLELPYSSFYPWMSDEIDAIVARTHLRPVLAHIERYLSWYRDEDFFTRFNFSGVIYQFNVSSLSSMRIRSLIRKANSDGLHTVFGSDAHNMTERPPHFELYSKHSMPRFDSAGLIFHENNLTGGD